VLLLLALGGGWWLSSKDQTSTVPYADPASASTPVVVAATEPAQDNMLLDLVGSGIAVSSVTVFPEVAGEVERVLFTAGQQVKKDQLLIKLVDRDEQLAVKLA